MSAASVVTNPRRLGPTSFVREIARARRVGRPEPETVFRLLRPFHGPELDGIYARVMADPDGRRILQAGQSLHPTLLDFDRLRSLPGGTLGREYLRFMEDNEIDIVSFTAASLRHMARGDYANDEAWTLANRLRDIHEIVHVISGYGTDVLGEMGELAFNINEDPRPKATRFAIRVNVAMFRRNGYAHGERVIAEAFRRAPDVGVMVGTDWEAMMDRPLEAVRERLGIGPPPRYAPIHLEDAPPALVDLARALLTPDPATAA